MVLKVFQDGRTWHYVLISIWASSESSSIRGSQREKKRETLTFLCTVWNWHTQKLFASDLSQKVGETSPICRRLNFSFYSGLQPTKWRLPYSEEPPHLLSFQVWIQRYAPANKQCLTVWSPYALVKLTYSYPPWKKNMHRAVDSGKGWICGAFLCQFLTGELSLVLV